MEILWPLQNSASSYTYDWNVSIGETLYDNLNRGVFEPIGFMQGWDFKSIHPHCTSEAKGTTFKFCHPEFGCDELSRYAEPRSSFHMDHDDSLQTDDEFLQSVTCYRLGQLNCPATVPIALRIHMKAGSRAATLWAAALEEGLLRRLKALRHEAEEESQHSGWMWWYLQRLSLEVFEIAGCHPDMSNMQHQQSLAVQHVHYRHLGAPLALSPTCCSTGVGRLRVAFVRHPFARLWSYYDSYVFASGKGSFAGSFELWIKQLLDAWPYNWKCERSSSAREYVAGFAKAPDVGLHRICKSPWLEVLEDVHNDTNRWRFTYMDWEHLVPIAVAIRAEGHGDPKHFFPFRLESPADSLNTLSGRLCEQFDYCHSHGLPPFPLQLKTSASRLSRRTGSSEWPQSLRDALALRYQEDFTSFGYTVAWHPRTARMR